MCSIKKICVINQKGGVGKTTTAVSLASGLSRSGFRVLLIDMDPQGNVAHSLTSNKSNSLYNFLMGECSMLDCTTNLGTNLDLIHSNETLTKAEIYLSTIKNGQRTLSNKLLNTNGYDYIIVDCAPSLGILNQNAMLFCDEAIIPVSTNYLALNGLKYIIEAIAEVNKHFNHKLEITHVIPTMHDKRNKMNKIMLKKLMDDYKDKVTTPVRINSKLAEAPAKGKSIFSYDPKSRGAEDYGKIVQRVIAKTQKIEKRVEELQKVTINTAIPISARVQRLMKDKIEFED